jgi:hypothetical protein
MRTLVYFLISRLARSRIGRWALTAVLFLIAAFGFLAYPTVSASQSASDGLTWLVTGVLFTGLGIVMLVVTLRLERVRGRVKRAEQAGLARANEIIAQGLLLPIPPLPPPPKGVSPEDMAEIEGYVERMAKLPWGDKPQVGPAEAPTVFTRTVACVRRVRGDWSQLG